MGKPKVAIIENSIDVTGALNAIIAFAEYAQKDFYFFFILPSRSKAVELLKQKGFKVIEFPFLELNKSWKSFFLYLPLLVKNGLRLKQFVEKNNIQIVHVNDFYNMSGVMAKFLGGSFLLFTHIRFMPNRFPAPLVKCWIQLNLRYAIELICVSQAVKKMLPNHPKIRVVYDSLPVSQLVHKETVKQREEVHLLYLANYILGKGQDYALEAFALAYKLNPNLRLKFVGGDMGLLKNKIFKQNLIERAKGLSLRSVTTFCEATSTPLEELKECDIVLNFSESESFSLTSLEALMMGKPLIVTNCGGPVELFEHEVSGLLVPNKDIEAMCSAILHLAEDKEKRLKFSQNSVIYVKEKFAPEATFHKLSYIYHRVLND